MADPRQVKERQADWQASRRQSSWAEKVHQAEALRDSIRQVRGSADKTRQSGERTRGRAKP